MVRALAGTAACGPLASAHVLDVDDAQPQQLDHSVVGREVAAGLGDLADLVVQAFNGVGGVEQLADGGAEGQERGEGVPGISQTRTGCGSFRSLAREDPARVSSR